MQRMPRTEGFFGLVRPVPEKIGLLKESLLSKAEYETLRNVSIKNGDT